MDRTEVLPGEVFLSVTQPGKREMVSSASELQMLLPQLATVVTQVTNILLLTSEKAFQLLILILPPLTQQVLKEMMGLLYM